LIFGFIIWGRGRLPAVRQGFELLNTGGGKRIRTAE